MPDPSASSELHRPLFAIGLRLAAVVCVSIMFVTVRLASQHGVHLLEILFYRQLVAMPVVFGYVAMSGGLRYIRLRRIGGHASRTAMGLIGMALNFGAFILLPPAEATTIGFTMPIFGTIIAALFLHEPTGIHRWGAVLLGFMGVLVMVQPDSGHFPMLGVAVALAGALNTVLVSILLRQLGRTENAGTIVFWFTALSLPPLGIGAFFYSQAHDMVAWGLVALIGVAGAVGQILLTAALRWGPLSIVLPMDYSTIIWTTLLGWIIWDVWPMGTTWIGAALIIASGLYIAWREHVRARRMTVTQAIQHPG
ncbi:MAG: DMT family transporter [Sphingobium sp.]